MDLVVLAGGRSRRMGSPKALLEFGGIRLIDRVISRLRPLFDQVIISSARGDSFPGTEALEVADIYADCGSLGGLHAGLEAADSSRIFAVACDMPFVNPHVVSKLVSLSDEWDVVVPSITPENAACDKPEPMKLEPLHAVYSKACLPHIRSLLEKRSLRVYDFFGEVRVRYVGLSEISSLDSRLLSFLNINTEKDLEKAYAIERCSDQLRMDDCRTNEQP